ncbi:cell wall hydrolase [Breoghania corrubedonensis]|uniref:Cell wall hydrolase n=1 Tax=Breoghania corrubedonensis TaxID=665038 RepID=A0A2T5VEQ4_9HYPH|nr:cell wall hydrolase [Breoghania corrubedonensis]PTW62206.1 cell wall hydrolase [Breoghania corrubedonensis]
MSGLSALKISRVAGTCSRSVLLGLAIYFGFPETFAFQDTLSLMQREERSSTRWLAAIQATGETSSAQPTLTLASADAASGPSYQITTRTRNGRAAIVTGISADVYGRGIVQVPEEVRTNRASKGNRLVSVAPDRQMVDQSAGSVYYMGSLIGAEPRQSLPRVAFVQPQAMPQNRMVASANQATRSDGKPLNLNKMLMARAAAAAGFSSLSAYAPSAVEDTSLPFAALFGMPPGPTPEEEAVDRENPHWWVSNPLPANVILPKEQRCLAEAIYFEARGEPESGQAAVAQVVLNRVKNPAYPATICKVVYQNRTQRNSCQFSFACDGLPERIVSKESWEVAQRLAREIVAGKHWSEKIGASTHYHATYVRPRWARKMKRLGKIGRHVFYQTYGGGWG